MVCRRLSSSHHCPTTSTRSVTRGHFGRRLMSKRVCLRTCRAGKVGALPGDLLGCELPIKEPADRSGVRPFWEAAQHARQEPVAVHARVPVIAAVEDRVQGGGWTGIFRADQGMGEMVRVLAGDVAEHGGHEAVGNFDGQGVRHEQARDEVKLGRRPRGLFRSPSLA